VLKVIPRPTALRAVGKNIKCHNALQNTPQHPPHITPQNAPHITPHNAPHNEPYNAPRNVPHNMPHNEFQAPHNKHQKVPHYVTHNARAGECAGERVCTCAPAQVCI
jgi:hypothetical protein